MYHENVEESLLRSLRVPDPEHSGDDDRGSLACHLICRNATSIPLLLDNMMDLRRQPSMTLLKAIGRL